MFVVEVLFVVYEYFLDWLFFVYCFFLIFEFEGVV